MFMYYLAPLDLLQLSALYAAVIPAAMAARLILNLRAAFKTNTQSSGGRTSEWGTCDGEVSEAFELRARSGQTDSTAMSAA